MSWDDDDEYSSNYRSELRNNERNRDINRKVNKQSSDFKKIEKELTRLKLVTEAMWELLKSSTDFNDEQLRQQIKTLDLSDGSTDGKAIKSLQLCSGCHRKSAATSTKCMYCGLAMNNESLF